MTNKEKLIEMYKQALNDASAYYKSDYCCSKQDDINRDKEDEELLNTFKHILEEV